MWTTELPELDTAADWGVQYASCRRYGDFDKLDVARHDGTPYTRAEAEAMVMALNAYSPEQARLVCRLSAPRRLALAA